MQKKYIQYKHGHLISNNVFKMIAKLNELENPNHKLSEKVDQLVTQWLIIAAKKLWRREKYLISPKLTKEYAILNALWKCLSMYHAKVDMKEKIQEYTKQQKVAPFKIPQSIPKCCK